MCLLVGDVIMDLDFGHCEAVALRQGRADSGAVARRGLLFVSFQKGRAGVISTF